MIVDTNNMISITEANQNFSKICRMVDDMGNVIILKNNKPIYVLSKFDDNSFSENDMLELIARRILSEHKHAFEELAK